MKALKTTVDWLRFRTQAEVAQVLEAMRPLFGVHSDWLRLEYLGRGMDGFEQACSILYADEPVGRVDYGGESQRGWVRVNLTGRGCELVVDWDACEELERLAKAQLRRADLALTTWRGEVTHDQVVQAHARGGFTGAGRPPTMRQVISSDPNDGRTVYIGKRDASKFARCYEKGLELCQKYGIPVDDSTAIDGHPVRGIYRCELELKAADADLPWELVASRDQYFAGAYPFFGELLPDVEPDILMRRPDRAPQLALQAVLRNVRTQYGASLFTALTCYHGDVGRLMAQIVGREHNKALVAAGVLMADHPE
jgi:phage replication initiation protein